MFSRSKRVLSVFVAFVIAGSVFLSPVQASGVLGVTQITAVQTFAQNDNTFEHGWKWVFDVTVPANEPVLQMKFADWVGITGNIPAGSNIRFYSGQSSNAFDADHAIIVSAANTYGNPMNLLSGADLNDSKADRQIEITVEARVPTSSLGGSYSTSYGINSGSDNVAPVITLNGVTPVTLEVGSNYEDAGATALDNIDGVLVPTLSGTVDTAKLGTYNLDYNVSDSVGNPAVQVTRTVNVVDTAKPVIKLNGADPQVIEIGTNYSELGATVTDNYNNGISAVIDASLVNTSALGFYAVTYTAEDSSHNQADPITRTVEVVDTTKPVITLIGDNLINLTVGDSYTDAGATSLDNVDGTVAVSATGSVDTNTAGTYTLRYNITDSSGNVAVEVTRTVNVHARQITVTADPQEKVFGKDDPALTYKITSGTLLEGDSFGGNITRETGDNVGTYDITQGTLSLNSTKYELTFIPSVFTITQASAEVALSDLSQTYDGTPKSATVTTVPADITTSVTYDGSSEAPTNAGSYDVVANITNPNYTGSANGTLIIGKVNATVTATGVDKTYDGMTHADTLLSVAGVVHGDILTSTGNASFSDKNVGNGKMVTVTGITLSGENALNYTFNTETSTTANITKAPLTVSATGGSKVYDGNTSAHQVTLTANVASGDDVTVSGVSYFFVDKNVGMDKPIEVERIAVGGADANNYTWTATTVETTASITQKALTITGLTAKDKIYDGNTVAVLDGVAGLSGVVTVAGHTDDVTLQGTPVGTFADASIGNRQVTVIGFSLTGADAGNYTLAELSLIANILPVPAANLSLAVPTEVTVTKSQALIPENNGVPIDNSAVETAVTGLTPIDVTLENTGTADSQNVRINPIGNNSGHIQLWAKDSSDNWYDVNVLGWGPATGFPVTIGSSTTTDVYAVSDLPGDYSLAANLVLVSDSSVVTSANGIVHIVFNPAIDPTITSFDVMNGDTKIGDLAGATLLTNNTNTISTQHALSVANVQVANGPLVDGEYEFKLPASDDQKTTLKNYFTGKGWQDYMITQINREIDGTKPYFYFKVDGLNYSLEDGFRKFFGMTDSNLKPFSLIVDDDYPAGTYIFVGTVGYQPVTITLTVTKPESGPVNPPESTPVKPASPSVTNDDTLNTVTGMATGMEYNLDGSNYVAYDATTFGGLDFSGNRTLFVRVSAEGINPASDPVTLTFTTNPITTPSVVSYTFNGVAGDLTVNPTSNPVTINLISNENVDWTRITIESQSDSNSNKYYQPSTSCDGKLTCTETWDGKLSSGSLIDGDYRIKVHIKDSANQEFNDYITPYVIKVNTVAQ